MQAQSIEGFQLSPQQKRLWQLQQVDGSQPYRVQCAVLIQGTLNAQILESALRQVVERHEILRTTFPTLSGMTLPLQVITENSLPTLHYHNFSDLDPETQKSKIAALADAAMQLPCNFEQGPLLQLNLVMLSPAQHLLLVGLSALCADRASIKHLVQEISCAYTACLQGEELPDEPLQYVDLAEWQNELFAGEEAAVGKEFWHQQDFSVSTLKLPFEHRCQEKFEFQPQIYTLTIQADQSGKMAAIAQQYETSASIFLLACWQILLWRLTGQSDLVIGIGCDGRNYQELKSAFGLFAKYLPLHCPLAEDSQFSNTLQQVSESVQQVYEWQETFTWDDISGVNIHSQFFPFCFDFEEMPTRDVTDNLSFSIDRLYACIDRFKIKLSCLGQDDRLSAEFHYDANLFQPADIERLAWQFQTLLDSAINHPQVLASELEILSDRQRQQLLFEFNNTKLNYPKDGCIHNLFEAQAEHTPNHIAVVFENQQLTYAQLNARANQLARHLQTLGVGPETIVALGVERSLETFIGMLGILKAGGAYLPLDPLLPTERLAFMLHDAQASVLVTQQHLAERFPEVKQTVCLDTDWDAIAQQPDETLDSEVTPQNLVYIIYTSGSTGQPKGVAVEHRQLLNYLHGILEKLNLPNNSIFATVSTFAADLGNTAIFPALCTGGCLHVISQERATNPEALADYCDRHPIDCLKIAPSHLNALLTAASPVKILPCQRLILGGEALSWQLVEKLQQYKPTCQILNHYGPTEATVGVLTYAIQGEPIGDKSEIVPLGRAIANTQVYILDKHLQPVPIGVPGELHIGGDSLARGYLNQPELTTKRFIRNPFSDQLESRLYKTGDLVRYRPDGNIEFLGRIDRQVKIRGFRVEPEEIEMVLRQHSQVQEAAVTALEDESGSKYLVAYVVPIQESPTTGELRRFIKEKLPEQMVPSAFVLLKSLPLTANGKIDRQRLPLPDLTRPQLEATYEAPQTDIEQAIATIWQEMLRVEKVGIYDNFFELGGHSLLIIQVYSKLRGLFKDLAISDIFKYPTIDSLAKYLSQAQTQQSSSHQSDERAEIRRELMRRQMQSRQQSRTTK